MTRQLTSLNSCISSKIDSNFTFLYDLNRYASLHEIQAKLEDWHEMFTSSGDQKLKEKNFGAEDRFETLDSTPACLIV